MNIENLISGIMHAPSFFLEVLIVPVTLLVLPEFGLFSFFMKRKKLEILRLKTYLVYMLVVFLRIVLVFVAAYISPSLFDLIQSETYINAFVLLLVPSLVVLPLQQFLMRKYSLQNKNVDFLKVSLFALIPTLLLYSWFAIVITQGCAHGC